MNYTFVNKHAAKVGDVIQFFENGKIYPAKVFDRVKDKEGDRLLVKVIGIEGDSVRNLKV